MYFSLCFGFQVNAYLNRVSGNHLPDDQPVCATDSVPLSTFIPNEEDDLQIKKDFIFYIGKIWIKHIKYLEEFSDVFPAYLKHVHEKEMKTKTQKVQSL